MPAHQRTPVVNAEDDDRHFHEIDADRHLRPRGMERVGGGHGGMGPMGGLEQRQTQWSHNCMARDTFPAQCPVAFASWWSAKLTWLRLQQGWAGFQLRGLGGGGGQYSPLAKPPPVKASIDGPREILPILRPGPRGGPDSKLGKKKK